MVSSHQCPQFEIRPLYREVPCASRIRPEHRQIHVFCVVFGFEVRKATVNGEQGDLQIPHASGEAQSHL